MKYISLIIILLNNPVNAQQNPGPRSVAMGSAGVALQDIWSLQQNPAGIAGIKDPLLSIGYEQHFLSLELSTQTALFVLPYQKNVFGFSFERYGFSEYKEQNFGIAYSRKFGNSLNLAIGFRYYQLSITEYGSSKAFSAEAGMQFDITDKLTLASHISNPGRASYEGFSGSRIPVRLSFGASYRFSDRIIMIADLKKVLNSATDVRFGLEYNIITWFSLRGGISANPFKQFAGFGLNSNRLFIDVAAASHPSLGYSPQLALGYEF